MSKSIKAPNEARCPRCDSQVFLVNGLFPPHVDSLGERCPGLDAEPGGGETQAAGYELGGEPGGGESTAVDYTPDAQPGGVESATVGYGWDAEPGGAASTRDDYAPDAEPGGAGLTTVDYAPDAPSFDNDWREVSPPQVSSSGAFLPSWITSTAHRPAAGMVGWGLVLAWIGPVLAWFGLSVQMNNALSYNSGGGGGGQALTVIGGLLSLGGLVMLCVGITRLVAKADVAFGRRQS